jgi:O-antigen ligase
MALLSFLSRGGAVIGLILLIVALLKQLILVVGVLLALVKLAIIVVFVAVMVMIALAIYRDYSSRKNDTSNA